MRSMLMRGARDPSQNIVDSAVQCGRGPLIVLRDMLHIPEVEAMHVIMDIAEWEFTRIPGVGQ